MLLIMFVYSRSMMFFELQVSTMAKEARREIIIYITHLSCVALLPYALFDLHRCRLRLRCVCRATLRSRHN
jgi:hypothetical protein